MIDHISLHVSDIKRSVAFYVAALKPLGYEVVMSFDDTYFGLGAGGKPDLWLGPGQGGAVTHLALAAQDRAAVDAFYQAAMAAGGKDNGGPGLRPHYHPNYYGAFVFDPDGNNLEAVCHRPA